MARLTVVDPRDFIKIVGATFVKREHLPVLSIGQHSWNRWQLGRLGCAHPMAAAKLNRVCQELRIRTLDGLAAHAQEIGQYKGVGVTSYYTILALLEQAGFDATKVHGDETTFSTVKARALRSATKNRKRKPRRAGPPSEAAEGASA